MEEEHPCLSEKLYFIRFSCSNQEALNTQETFMSLVVEL